MESHDLSLNDGASLLGPGHKAKIRVPLARKERLDVQDQPAVLTRGS